MMDAKERVTMESGSGMMRTWSVLVPSLIHYPHKYPIEAAPYLLVGLVGTKKLRQQHPELSKPANADACFLMVYPSLPSTRRLLSEKAYSATRVRFEVFGQKDIYLNGGTCAHALPMPS